MIRYVVRRLILSIPILLLVTMMVFGLIHLIPGDPARVILGQEATPEAIAGLRHELGLDRPLVVQYLTWLGNVLRGDLGRSLADRSPVIEQIKVRLPVTLELAIGTFIVALLIALPAGILSATRRGSLVDYISTLVALGGLSIPSFWLGIMFILFFAVRLHWLPASGYVPFTEDPRANLSAMILPMVATGIREAAALTRMLRSGMLEVLNADYVRTARSKGLNERLVTIRHAFRNALVPVVTSAGLLMAGLLGGLVITETIFAIPGFGRLIVEAIYQRDFVTVQGAVLVSALLVILINLIVDLVYALVDPRIRLA
ncbi:MAG TPA: ABC transporter permease [Roseiflexaceae bacterium]|jgi:peptide/nickel transport system permease protein|nr:ABC transporter permease [Roseiflexaceae bacterium]